MDAFTKKLMKGLSVLEPYIERTTLEYVPECHSLSSHSKNPSILYVLVEPNVFEVPEEVAIILREIGWTSDDDFSWICYEAE